MIEDKREYHLMMEIGEKIEKECDEAGADVFFSDVGVLPIKMDVHIRAYGQEKLTEAVNENGEKVLVLTPQELAPGWLELTYETGKTRIRKSRFRTDDGSMKKLIKLFQKRSALMMAAVYAQYAETLRAEQDKEAEE